MMVERVRLNIIYGETDLWREEEMRSPKSSLHCRGQEIQNTIIKSENSMSETRKTKNVEADSEQKTFGMHEQTSPLDSSNNNDLRTPRLVVGCLYIGTSRQTLSNYSKWLR